MERVPSFTRSEFSCRDVGDRYASSRLGGRFAVCHATPGTVIDESGVTAFSATDPSFAFYQTAQSTRVILSGMTLTQTGTVAGDDIGIAIVIDTTNRYSAGGTLVTPQPMDGGQSGAANVSFRTQPTLAAAGTTHRTVFHAGATEAIGTVSSFCFGDGIMIAGTGTIAIYTWAATTGPQWYFDFEIIEETV